MMDLLRDANYSFDWTDGRELIVHVHLFNAAS